MSVSDNDHLRTNLLELCGELRRRVIALKRGSSPTELATFRQARGATPSAAACLISSRYDCPSYIAVPVVTLVRSLAALAKSIQKLDAESSMTLA